MIRKILVAFFSILALAGATFAFYKFVYLKSAVFNKAGLTVNTFYPGAKVYLDNEPAGETPFSTQNLASGEVTLAVDGRYGRFEDKITLEKNTIALVELKIAPIADLTQTQILWLERQPGEQTLSVLSNVLGVRVALDGQDKGLAPLTVDDITPGEHSVAFSKDGFEPIAATVTVLADHRVNFKVSLVPILAAQEPKTIEYPSNLIAVVNYTPEFLPSFLVASPASWVRGLAFLKESQDQNYQLSFNYLLDYEGSIYDSSGHLVEAPGELNLKEGVKFGYLGRDPALETLSQKAGESLDNFLKIAFGDLGQQIEILPTGLGFLRVRERSQVSALEVGRVTVGDKYQVLGQENGWYKIEYTKGKEGWISGDYAKEVTP